MTTALWGVLLLTLAGGAHAADGRAGARAPLPHVNAPTQSRIGSPAKTARPSKSAEPTSENYKADMATCRSMADMQRSACEHEMHAARVQGLYHE